MAERRMLLNSAETFIGTMRIEYYCENNRFYLNLNDNIKIIEEYFNGGSEGYYIVGFKKDLIVPENFINHNNDYCEIYFYSGYNIIFDTRSIYIIESYFYGNFIFNVQSITASYIHLYDYNYVFNDDDCFDIFYDGSISFWGKIIPQYYENTNNYPIYANAHILYDLMKYNNIEEGDEEALKYKILDNTKLIISSSTGYGVGVPNVDLGNNNYIKSINSYRYNGTHITEYICNTHITYLRKGISLPLDSTVYFPDTVTDIDSNTFESESNLKKVVIFGNCKLIELTGFKNSNLENIEIYSDNITRYNDAFMRTKLKSLYLSKNVISLYSSCVNDCSNLEIIKVSEDNPIFSSPDNCNAIITSTYQLVIGCKNTIIPEYVKRINNYAFFGMGLSHIVIPNNITNLNTMSFALNGDLTIEYNGTEEEWNSIIKEDSWDYLSDITYIFKQVPPDNEIWYTSTDGNIIDVNTEYINNELLSNTYEDKGKLVFKNVINSIDYLFKDNTQLEEVWLPDYDIPNTISAFEGCTNLIRVNNSKRLLMGAYIFRYCENLNRIEIDSSLIGDRAFVGCTLLNYVKISKRVETIDQVAFGNCTSLQAIDYEGTIEEWNNININGMWNYGSTITTIHCSDGDIQL